MYTQSIAYFDVSSPEKYISKCIPKQVPARINCYCCKRRSFAIQERDFDASLEVDVLKSELLKPSL